MVFENAYVVYPFSWSNVEGRKHLKMLVCVQIFLWVLDNMKTVVFENALVWIDTEVLNKNQMCPTPNHRTEDQSAQTCDNLPSATGNKL